MLTCSKKKREAKRQIEFNMMKENQERKLDSMNKKMVLIDERITMHEK